MKNFELFNQFVSRVMGKPLRETVPEFLTGTEVSSALWPLLEELRPDFLQIRALAYDPTFETEVDVAIAQRFLEQDAAAMSSMSAGAWRVWLERLTQMVNFAEMNALAGNDRFMPVPSGLPPLERAGAAALFLLHQMTLPQKPSDRSGDKLPAWSARGSLLRH